MTKNEFSSIGQTLKQRRVELSLSLKEAQSATSIQMAYLLALEEGQIDKLISPVYAQGFLKQYAKYLGLDGDLLVRENPELFQFKGKQEFDFGIGTMEARGTPGAGVKWIPNALWLTASLLLLAVAWIMGRYFEIL